MMYNLGMGIPTPNSQVIQSDDELNAIQQQQLADLQRQRQEAANAQLQAQYEQFASDFADKMGGGGSLAPSRDFLMNEAYQALGNSGNPYSVTGAKPNDSFGQYRNFDFSGVGDFVSGAMGDAFNKVKSFQPDTSAWDQKIGDQQSTFGKTMAGRTDNSHLQNQAYAEMNGGNFAGGVIGPAATSTFGTPVSTAGTPNVQDLGLLNMNQPWSTPGFGNPGGGSSIGGFGSPGGLGGLGGFSQAGQGQQQPQSWGGPFGKSNPWALS